jgi:hypothetical protein
MIAVSTLDARAEEIVKAIRAHKGAWVSRADIAEALGRGRLRESEVIVLDYLLKEGVIESKKEEIPGNIPVRWVYRLK